jgi:two-component system, OmpR family, response regulator MprA
MRDIGDGSRSTSPARRKILIVDDDPDLLLLLRTTLESEGYDAALASDGRAALARIGEDEPDLVLLDLMMPVLDGWGVLDALAGTAPRVVVVSAKSGEQDMARAYEMGAAEYVVKPYDPLTLVETIRSVLDRSEEDERRHRSRMLAELVEREATA